MEQNEFWQVQANNKFWNEYFIDGQKQEWIDIVMQWGKSTVALKNWLNKYYPLDDKNFCNKIVNETVNINVNYLLPYMHNKLWFGDEALYRLRLAMQAKLIILSKVEGVDKMRSLYAVECLRLWLRINSTKTKLSWEEFVKMLDDVYLKTQLHWDDSVKYINNKCKLYKPRRKQTIYKYREIDFNGILPNMKLDECYQFWQTYNFPNLLRNYKLELIKDYENKLRNSLGYGEMLDYNLYKNKINKYKEDLELIQIKEISKKQFNKYLDKFHIEYLKNNRKN